MTVDKQVFVSSAGIFMSFHNIYVKIIVARCLVGKSYREKRNAISQSVNWKFRIEPVETFEVLYSK